MRYKSRSSLISLINRMISSLYSCRIYKQLALVFLQQKSKKAGKLDLMSNFPAGRLFGFCGGYGECLFDEADDELFLTDLLAQSLGLAGEVCLQPLEEFLGNLQC